MINEDLAKRNQENAGFSEYDPGSASREYEAALAEARMKVEAAKEKVSEEGKCRLESLFTSYGAKLAAWTNRRNESGAGHVSVMVAGPSGYNVRKHEKWLIKEGRLWEEYKAFGDLDGQIAKIIRGDRIIRGDDESAISRLREKLASAEEEHAKYKEFNVKRRRAKEETLPAYVLSNSSTRIRSIKKRIEQLEKQAHHETTREEVNGILIVDNGEANRLQVFFPDKPGEETISKLKAHGFRWARTIGAWQRHRSPDAKHLAGLIAEQELK